MTGVITKFAEISMGELGVLLTAVFTAFGAILIGFYKYAAARERDFERSRKIMATAYENSNKSLSKALDRVAVATERSADEAKQRNGHLGELLVQNNHTILEVADRNLQAIQNVHTQNVIKQNIKQSNVQEETIQNETIKRGK